MSIQATNRFAFKEWAVVCAALQRGLQSLILRKGGIHEGREGFRVQHQEFWLFPTAFHQQREDLAEFAWSLLSEVQDRRVADDEVHLPGYAVVEDVYELTSTQQLPLLEGLHVWSHRTLDQRFHYRTPGLYLLAVRVYALPEPIVLPNSPHFAGCRSWVDLPKELSTADLRPVIDDDEHRRRMTDLRDRLSERRLM